MQQPTYTLRLSACHRSLTLPQNSLGAGQQHGGCVARLPTSAMCSLPRSSPTAPG